MQILAPPRNTKKHYAYFGAPSPAPGPPGPLATPLRK